MYLKGEFNRVYNEFNKERHLLTVNIFKFQEDTLLSLATCKEHLLTVNIVRFQEDTIMELAT